MKPKDKWLLAIVFLLCLSAAVGCRWYLQVQKDRGHYHYGFRCGELERITHGHPPALEAHLILRDERAKRFYEEGYADAHSQLPPRYPYAPLHLDPAIFAPGATK